MVTDRDICMAAYTRGAPLQAVFVASTMTQPATTCSRDSEVAAVAASMRGKQLHRIPVVDDEGRPIGIVSLNDMAIASQQPRSDVDVRDVAATLAAIGTPRRNIVRAA
jgi:CBS-domain-containing membrane protein